MPTYIYQCDGCGTTLERRQSFTDAPLTLHEECGGSLRRVLHPAAVIFKGSGFYSTDYRSTSNGSTSGNANGSKSTSDDSKTGSDGSKATSDGSKAASSGGESSSSASDTATKATTSD